MYFKPQISDLKRRGDAGGLTSAFESRAPPAGHRGQSGRWKQRRIWPGYQTQRWQRPRGEDPRAASGSHGDHQQTFSKDLSLTAANSMSVEVGFPREPPSETSPCGC